MPCAILGGEFVFHALCYFMWGVSLIKLYMPYDILCGEFLLVLHTVCCVATLLTLSYMLCTVL